MNETQYIWATNRVKISIVLEILRDILADDDEGNKYGISEETLKTIRRILRKAEDRLFKYIQTDD